MSKQSEPVCMCGHTESDHVGGIKQCSDNYCVCKSFTDRLISHRRAALANKREAGSKVEILKLLEAKGIRFFRLNSFEAIVSNPGGRRKYRIIGNRKGTPDIQCILPSAEGFQCKRVAWIEVKKSDGTQSKEQIEFQTEAEANGETYLLARSVQDIAKWLEENA